MKYIKKYEDIKESYYSVEQVKNLFYDELSKYFTKIPDDKGNWIRNSIDDSIFLLSPDYGVRIRSITDFKFTYLVELCTIKHNPTTNEFRNGIVHATWNSYRNGQYKPIEDFVKEFANKVTKINIQRLKNKETIELKRMSKKYNIR